MDLEYLADNEKSVETWEDFLIELKNIDQFREQEKQNTDVKVLKLIYRGQANSNWRLETTLERFIGKDKYGLGDYYGKIYRASHQIEAFTREKWTIPYKYLVYPEVLEITHFEQVLASEPDLSTYLLYLRHHSFPSPLLDWTMSPFIAAYFAFNKQQDLSQYVSIYIYLEHFGKGMGVLENQEIPRIYALAYVRRSHERHFLQQCKYTYCIKEESEGGLNRRLFASHQEVFSAERNIRPYIWKFNIPITERKKVLTFLDSVNINEFSLFQSNESLMTTMATRYFFLEE